MDRQPHIEIVYDGDVGPTMLTMDNTALIDPFESDFILNIPIRIDWGIVGMDGKDIEPKLQMQDLDNPLYTMLSVCPADTSRFGATATVCNSTSEPTRSTTRWSRRCLKT